MKKRFQKLISFALVLVMLVTMLPMGVVTATAEGEVSAELAAGLADIANTSEFVIKSVADWKAVSAIPADDKVTFSEKTVKLGADIDFGGETVEPLFAYNFYGTFDGQGNTLKNAKVTSAEGNVGLVFRKLDGGLVTNLVIDGVTVTNTSETVTDRTGILSGYASTWTDLTVTKITIKNSTVNANKGSAGLLVGTHYNNGQTDSFTKLSLAGTVNSTACIAGDAAKGEANNAIGVGGVVGEVNIKGGNTSWSGIETNVAVVTNKTTPATYLGSFAGTYTAQSGRKADITNIYLGGSVTDENLSSASHAGFVGQFRGTAGQDMAGINNVILAADLSAMCGNSLTFANVWNGNLVYTNVFSTTASNNGTWTGQTQRWTGMSNNMSSFFGGILALWENSDKIKDTVQVIPMAIAKMMVATDENGYITEISSIASDDTVLPDYDTTEEFVINSVEDWKLLASSKKSFSGKTIKLGADIDAKGEALPMLILNMTATNVIFDGCGFAIKNVGTSKNPIKTPLIAYQLGAATVQNITFENVHISLEDAAGLISFSMKNDGTALIQNIKVVGCTVTSTANTAGGLIGNVGDTAKTNTTTFKNINIDATTAITGKSATGGVIGTFRNNGTVNVSNVITYATVMGTTEINAYDTSVGGLIGYSYTYLSADINVHDCYIGGTLTTPGGKDKGIANLAGTIGVSEGDFPGVLTNEDGTFKAFDIEGGGRTLNINNIIVECDFYTATRWDCIISTTKAPLYYNYKNVYSLKSISGAAPKPLWQFVCVNHWVITNGRHQSGEINLNDDVLVLSPFIAKRLTKIDESTGFLTKIDSVIEPYGYECSEVKDGKYSIRFLGTTNLIEEANVYMNVKATTASGVVKTFRVLSPLFERVTPFEDHGIVGQIVAQEIGVEKMLCVTVYDIPVGEAITFELSLEIVTAQERVLDSSQTLTVPFDANGAPIVNQ